MTTLFPDAGNWRAGMQDVSAAIDDTMGELVMVTPVDPVKPNHPSVPRHAEATTAIAVFTTEAVSALGKEQRVGGREVAPLVSTRKPVFSFGYGALPFPILQYYRIKRLCSGEMFEVTDIRADGVSRFVCSVKQLGRQKDEY